MTLDSYDMIVIGGGAGGFVSSKMARGMGKKVALVEKHRLGGDCTWSGCIPSKTLIRSAGIAHQMGRIREYGLKLTGKPTVDASGVMEHVRSVINRVYSGHLPESFEKEGIEIIFGSPRFINQHTIQIGDTSYRAKKFIIATGSGPFVPPVEGLSSVSYLTSNTLFTIKKLPRSMIVMGAGPIGSELAMALNRLGVKVTVVEMAERILIREDREMANMLADIMADEGIVVITDSRIVKFEKSGSTVKAHLADGNGRKSSLHAEAVLLAAGRRPNIDGLELENAGIKCTEKGIITDRHLRTTAPNVYACGDVAGPYQFSHMAEYQAVIAVGNALLPLRRRVRYDHVTWCTFTDPELAHAGMTEEEARERYGNNIRIYRYFYNNTDRGKTDGVDRGMSKIIINRKGRILGIHILGPAAGEIMHELQLAKTLGVNFRKVRSVIHAYPSYSDVVRQPSKLFYIDSLRENPIVKLLSIMFPKKQGR